MIYPKSTDVYFWDVKLKALMSGIVHHYDYITDEYVICNVHLIKDSKKVIHVENQMTARSEYIFEKTDKVIDEKYIVQFFKPVTMGDGTQSYHCSYWNYSSRRFHSDWRDASFFETFENAVKNVLKHHSKNKENANDSHPMFRELRFVNIVTIKLIKN